MVSFFKDIFSYHHHLNQKIGGQIRDLGGQAPEKVIYLFSHVVLAHQIWNARILETEQFNLHHTLTVDEALKMDQKNLEDTAYILDKVELHDKITYQNTKAQIFENSVSEILFHISNHATHHKGQIVIQLREKGIDPIVTDYIFFKRVANLS